MVLFSSQDCRRRREKNHFSSQIEMLPYWTHYNYAAKKEPLLAAYAAKKTVFFGRKPENIISHFSLSNGFFVRKRWAGISHRQEKKVCPAQRAFSQNALLT